MSVLMSRVHGFFQLPAEVDRIVETMQPHLSLWSDPDTAPLWAQVHNSLFIMIPWCILKCRKRFLAHSWLDRALVSSKLRYPAINIIGTQLTCFDQSADVGVDRTSWPNGGCYIVQLPTWFLAIKSGDCFILPHSSWVSIGLLHRALVFQSYLQSS